ncbi:MAG: S-layer homology domain-containing protein [Candidatus Gracilibacteria bacterium]
MPKLKSFLQNKHARHWIYILGILAVSVFSVNLHGQTGFLFGALSNIPEHATFDGTVMPIQQTPDWTNLTSSEYSYTYQELSASKLEDIPEYRTDYLEFPSEDLIWGNSEHDVIRNTKITYPVPYAGNYELNDCGEGCGSHPAVDIKTLKGTPVYAIANGVVTRAGTSSGFGTTIVLQTNGVPNPISPSQTTTIYSSYSHLSKLFVTEGEVVTKGSVIGEVGNSGTATTYHLHFQIDSSTAPWHPYWPFTTAEASAAGYGFWDAVSHGIGLDNVYKYTFNPMDFVKDNLDGSAVLGNAVVVENNTVDAVEPVETVEIVDVIETTDIPDELISSVVTLSFDSIRIETPYFTQPGENPEIKIDLLDSYENIDTDATFDGEITLSVSDESVGKLNRNSITKADFEDGVANLNLYADHDGTTVITASISGMSYVSSEVYVISQIEPFAKFGIAHDGYFVPNKAETIQIQALTLTGKPTPGFYSNGSLAIDLVEGSGSFSKTSFDKRDFPTGIAELSFTASSDDPVIFKVTYGTKITESETMESRLFNDLDASNVYYDAVAYLFDKGTVQGYPDGTFQPDRIVSRVESLKLIFSGLDSDLDSGLTVNFTDTRNGEWYSDYLATAYSIGVIEGYSDGSFKPSQGVNRVEFLKMLFNTVDITVDPIVSEDPYLDVDNLAWYAPSVAYAKEKNIFPISGQYFEPSLPMSRIEVAEVIYRLITVSQNDDRAYSVLLRPTN